MSYCYEQKNTALSGRLEFFLHEMGVMGLNRVDCNREGHDGVLGAVELRAFSFGRDFLIR